MASNFLHFFQLRPAALSKVRKVLRLTGRPSWVDTHCLSFLSVQPRPGNPWSIGALCFTVALMAACSLWVKKGCVHRYGGRPRLRDLRHCTDAPSPSPSDLRGRFAWPTGWHYFARCLAYITPSIFLGFWGVLLPVTDAADRLAFDAISHSLVVPFSLAPHFSFSTFPAWSLV